MSPRQQQDWRATLPLDAIGPEGVARCDVGGLSLAIYRVQDDYFATGDVCTHGMAHLSDGYLEGHVIECPLHQGLFDVRTGEAVGEPCTVAVRSYPVKVENGEIFVALSPGET